MIEYEDIINESPFLINHVITLLKTHDFYINKHIKSSTDILPSQYYMLLFLYYEMGTNQSDIAKGLGKVRWPWIPAGTWPTSGLKK